MPFACPNHRTEYHRQYATEQNGKNRMLAFNGTQRANKNTPCLADYGAFKGMPNT